MARKKTDLIVVHCADTTPDMDIGAKEIDRWHRQRGWLMIGYHWVIRRNGEIEPGRPEPDAGAHARGYNWRSIGICLVGGAHREPDGSLTPENNFTPEQFASLKKLLAGVQDRYPDTKEAPTSSSIRGIIGHHQVNPDKACPSFDVQAWLPENYPESNA